MANIVVVENGKTVPGLLNSPRDRPLSVYEKKFLLCSERGDVVSVRKLLEKHCKPKNPKFDINCVDPLNRTSLVLAIENENMTLIEVLLKHDINPGDALLHAIKEEYVEAVEVLLQHEEKIHKPGTPYSWEIIDHNTSSYTRDITPLILAAHKNNYEILKLLLDRGAAIPLPHNVRCCCRECLEATSDDHLRHSRSRINAYRALCSPSLIALSSRDPILTAFQLSWELRRLSNVEKEFAVDYKELRAKIQNFAVALLDHVRTNYELQIILNYDPTIKAALLNEDVDGMKLERLKLAIDYKQKSFVAHPNVQQLLASVWFQGMPGYKRKGPVGQAIEVLTMAVKFPISSLSLVLFPTTKIGRKASHPFNKFVNYSASYLFFLMLLTLESQRMESLFVEQLVEYVPDWIKSINTTGRGKPPNLTEWAILVYVIGFIWQETMELWSRGIVDYFSNMWNIVDFITNCFYANWIGLRVISYFQVYLENLALKHGLERHREDWAPYDPMLLSEGMSGAATIFSFLKLIHIFSVHPHLGPLQISLGRMVFDIIKFFFIYTWVVFAFGCGMNQLLWYYSNKDHQRCLYGHLQGISGLDQDHSCNVWRRFSNLFETSQTLFWASFGLIDLQNFELSGIKEFTRFWGLLMFGIYSIINVVVLLNLLIAMMSNSYQVISERRDTEWKFARSKLWISYFDDEDAAPPPFNLIPSFGKCCASVKHKMLDNRRSGSIKGNVNQQEYEQVMRCLVRRYVTREQRKAEETGLVTEDDVNELKQDIASFRYELLDLLQNNGMKMQKLRDKDVYGKKERTRERRLLKGFSIGLVEKVCDTAEASSDHSDEERGGFIQMLGSGSVKRKHLAKRRWTAAMSAVVEQHGTQIGRTDEEVNTSLADLKETVLKEQELVKTFQKVKDILTKPLKSLETKEAEEAKGVNGVKSQAIEKEVKPQAVEKVNNTGKEDVDSRATLECSHSSSPQPREVFNTPSNEAVVDGNKVTPTIVTPKEEERTEKVADDNKTESNCGEHRVAAIELEMCPRIEVNPAAVARVAGVRDDIKKAQEVILNVGKIIESEQVKIALPGLPSPSFSYRSKAKPSPGNWF